MPEFARGIETDLRPHLRVFYDDSGAVGDATAARRGRDPFCITVDSQTLQDQTVTVRDRDSMKQVRISADQLAPIFRNASARERLPGMSLPDQKDEVIGNAAGFWYVSVWHSEHFLDSTRYVSLQQTPNLRMLRGTTTGPELCSMYLVDFDQRPYSLAMLRTAFVNSLAPYARVERIDLHDRRVDPVAILVVPSDCLNFSATLS